MTRHVPLLWSVDYNNNQLICQQPTFSSPSQHILEILSSLLSFFLRNLPFILRPNFCIVVWQQLICWLAWYASLSMLLIGCPSLTNTGAFVDLHMTHSPYQLMILLCSVSLLTMAAISVDRLLALLLGLRYRVLVTLKRTYIILATFWVLSGFTAICYLLDPRIATWNSILFIPSCLSISLVSYTKIFRTLSHHQAQVQDHVQQQPNQPNALNMARYRKAVYSALWVQLAFVICYVPFTIVETVNALSKTYSSHLVINWGIALSFLYCNSTLNPFIYYWRIREVRRAVKQKIRQALHF